jgi:hypothetical protein
VSNKALTKQKGPNICWDTPKLIVFFLDFNPLPPAKKTIFLGESQQKFGISYL